MLIFHNVLRRVWENDRKSWATGILFVLLFILSLPYGMAIAFRNLLYDLRIIKQKKLTCRVISVGNISAGGTGKTPVAMMLAKMIRNEGYTPIVLSRGYRGENRGAINIVSDGLNLLMGHKEAGDEPFLMAKTLEGIPVITGSNRYLTGFYAIRTFNADVLILDDGFQHRSLYRDIDIVLVDYSSPFGNGRLLPCGNLRESPKGLRRADIIVLMGNGAEKKKDVLPMFHSLYGKRASIFHASHKPLSVIRADGGVIHPPGFLQGKRVQAFAGIGNPRSFVRTIESLGAHLVGFLSFKDHHFFTQADVNNIKNRAIKQKADLIMTTEKDGVRLLDFPDFLNEIYLLRIEIQLFDDRGQFRTIVLRELQTDISQDVYEKQ